MTLALALAPVAVPRRVARINPVAKLAVAMVLAVALVLSIDPVSAGVALAAELVLLPWLGLPISVVLRRTAPIWIAAPLGALTILLYGEASGQTHAQFLLVHVTDGSIGLAIATLLRVLAIALPSVLLFTTVDPTEFADALAQVLRLPSRFVLGSLGAVRSAGLIGDDWHALELARRARGVADRGRIRGLAGRVFGVLVLAIRRGSALATAMEARGLGAPGVRTWARPSRLHRRDAVFVGVGIAIAAAAVTTAVVTGQWNFIGSVRG
jgi:energy-coupling factor transport system permease protein